MSKVPEQEFKENLIKASKTARIYALSLTRNREAADDITQSALVKALENYDKFKSGTNLEAWLNTILKNIFYDHIKSHGVSRTEIMQDDKNYETGDSGSRQFDQVQITQINDFLNANCDEKTRSIFFMWVEGLKTEEIAIALDIGRSNVGVIICRVRKLLYQNFSDFQNE